MTNSAITPAPEPVPLGQEPCSCGHVYDDHRSDGICDAPGCPCWRYEETDE